MTEMVILVPKLSSPRGGGGGGGGGGEGYIKPWEYSHSAGLEVPSCDITVP